HFSFDWCRQARDDTSVPAPDVFSCKGPLTCVSEGPGTRVMWKRLVPGGLSFKNGRVKSVCHQRQDHDGSKTAGTGNPEPFDGDTAARLASSRPLPGNRNGGVAFTSSFSRTTKTSKFSAARYPNWPRWASTCLSSK